MQTVSFKEYEAAKQEIIGGGEYVESVIGPNSRGQTSKAYMTNENGCFYERVHDPLAGIIHFWSTKHRESRYCDDRPESGARTGTAAEAEPTSWTVYITKSRQAAYAIAHGLGCDWHGGANGVKGVKCGEADGEDGRRLVPARYLGRGWFYAAAEIADSDSAGARRHSIIVC
ncbi:MAG: hypothetical protein LBL83_11380 [Clostridiales bacterium]|jgi:hypothetical protein|nr:hypothetical protein [Clostridiales bacterium]